MRYSRALIPTFKETPTQTDSVSLQFLVRAGYIQQLTAGTYSFLPLGLRVIRKIAGIIDREINLLGGQEVFMPILQPSDLWREGGSGRWEAHKEKSLRVRDSQMKQYNLGSKCEELAIEIVRHGNSKSYKNFPILLHEFRKGFQNETPPRWGLVISREFFIHSSYYFDTEEAGYQQGFAQVLAAYKTILSRAGLKSVLVLGKGKDSLTEPAKLCSLSDTPTLSIAVCPVCDFAGDLEYTEHKPNIPNASESLLTKQIIHTPNIRTIMELIGFLESSRETRILPRQTLKTLIYVADTKPIAALVPGDRELSEPKLRKLLGCKYLELADETVIKSVTGAPHGFAGPMGFAKRPKVIADHEVPSIPNMIAGANVEDHHIVNVNFGRDYEADVVGDIAAVQSNDSCPQCGNPLNVKGAMELVSAHDWITAGISPSFRPSFTDKEGREQPTLWGSLIVDVGRIISVVVEQCHDEKGLIWPISIAPFQVILLVLDPESPEASRVSSEIYESLSQTLDVLIDDRVLSAGVKFNDADLLGIPFVLTVGRKGLDRGTLDIKNRKTGERNQVELAKVTEIVNRFVAEGYSGIGSH